MNDNEYLYTTNKSINYSNNNKSKINKSEINEDSQQGNYLIKSKSINNIHQPISIYINQ